MDTLDIALRLGAATLVGIVLGFNRDLQGKPTGVRTLVGCCWVLMALLFVGGVMNVLWIVLLALFISLEKVTSLGRQLAPVAGIILIAAGAWLLLGISEV